MKKANKNRLWKATKGPSVKKKWMAALIKLSKRSNWPALEINVKQGGGCFRANEYSSKGWARGDGSAWCAWHWKFLVWNWINSVARHLYANFLLHKLTLEPGVTPHMDKSAPLLPLLPPGSLHHAMLLHPSLRIFFFKDTKVKMLPFIYLGE